MKRILILINIFVLSVCYSQLQYADSLQSGSIQKFNMDNVYKFNEYVEFHSCYNNYMYFENTTYSILDVNYSDLGPNKYGSNFTATKRYTNGNIVKYSFDLIDKFSKKDSVAVKMTYRKGVFLGIKTFIIRFNPHQESRPSDNIFCKNDKEINLAKKLNYTDTANYTFSGTGIQNNKFYPSSVNAGNYIYTMVYKYNTYHGPSTVYKFNCSYTFTTSKNTVYSNPAITYNDTLSTCQGESGATRQLTTTNPTTVFSSYNSTTSVSTGGLLDISTSGTKAVKIIATSTEGCSTEKIWYITVKAKPVVTATDISKCVNAPAFTLTNGSPSGGTYKNSTSAVITSFNPQSYTIEGGVYPLTYTYKASNGCSSVADFKITLNALPTITNEKASENYCIGSTLTLSGVTPTGGTWSGTGVSSGKFTSSTVGTYTLKYVYVSSFGCKDSTTRNIDVYNKPTITLKAIDSLCKNVDPYYLTVSPSGGTWTSSSPVLQSSVGYVDPSKANAIDNIFTYSYTNSIGCTNTQTKTLRIYEKKSIDFGATQTVCKGGIVALTVASPPGGTWSGNYVSNGSFNSTGLSVGTYPVTYTYKNTGCVTVATKNVVVGKGVTANAGNDTIACRVRKSFSFENLGTPTGGVWTGNGIENGVIDPSTINVNSSMYTYTFTDSLGCTDKDSIKVSFVQSLNTPTVTVVNSSSSNNLLCFGDSLTLKATVSSSTSNTVYKWYRDAEQVPFTVSNNVKVSGAEDFLIYCEAWTSVSGCPSGEPSLTMINVKKPTGDFYISKKSVYSGDKIDITTTINADSYLYYFGDSLFSYEKEPTHYYYTSKKDTMDIKLITVDKDGCKALFSKPKSVIVFADSSTTTTPAYGVSNQASVYNTNRLEVYPNPFENHLTIDLYGRKFSEFVLEIINNEGVAIQKETVKGYTDSYTLNLEFLKSGIYLLKMNINDKVITQTIIKN